MTSLIQVEPQAFEVLNFFPLISAIKKSRAFSHFCGLGNVNSGLITKLPKLSASSHNIKEYEVNYLFFFFVAVGFPERTWGRGRKTQSTT